MATLSLRMRDDLKRKAQQMAKEQGVSLNAFVNATIAAAVAQQETMVFFTDGLNETDEEALHQCVLKFMRTSRPGKEPAVDEIERAMRR